MKYRYLGNSGLLVSRVCLGTMTFGMQGWGCDQATSEEITRLFIDAGGNFIDTADVYSLGVAEEIVGQALKQHKREDLVLATKCWFRMNPTPNAKGLSRKHIFEAIEASLKRLGTDYIDLYQLHGPDPHTPIEETLRAMDDLVRSGKVRYIGCSNFYAWQIVKANLIAHQMGLTQLISAQHMYSLLRRDVECEILPACADQGLGLMCWSPLASGLLTGKYTRETGPESDSRIGQRAAIDVPRYWNESSFRIVEEVQAVALEIGKTASQVALAWLLHDRRVTTVVIGSRSAAQVQDTLTVGDWDLPDELHKRLSEVVPIAVGYPADWIEITRSNTLGDEYSA